MLLAACSSAADKYPLRVGLIADIGQTANSTITRNRLAANSPDVIIHTGDNSYSGRCLPKLA